MVNKDYQLLYRTESVELPMLWEIWYCRV